MYGYLLAFRGEFALLGDQIVAIHDHSVHVVAQAAHLEHARAGGARLVHVVGLHRELGLPLAQLSRKQTQRPLTTDATCKHTRMFSRIALLNSHDHSIRVTCTCTSSRVQRQHRMRHD